MKNSELFEGLRKLFFVFGFWTSKPSKNFEVYSLFVLLFTVYLTVGYGLETVSALKGGLDQFGVNFGAFLTMMVTICKIGISRNIKFRSLLKEMFENEEYMSTRTEKSLRNSYFGYTRTPLRIVQLYEALMVCTLMSHAYLSIFLIMRYKDLCTEEEYCEKPLVFPYWMPFDKNEYYILANIYLDIVTIFSGMIVCACDLMVLTPIFYLICRLKTLKYVLSNPSAFFKEDLSMSKNNYIVVRQCVMEHQAIIKELKMFNSMAKYLLLFDFLFHSTQIAGFILSLIASVSIMTIENIFTLACAISIFLQLFLVYWHGQVLIDESGTISMSILQSDWYKADVKTRRLLIVMMIRSQKPLALTVGPFFLVNLEVFLKIVKAVYTITTVFFKH